MLGDCWVSFFRRVYDITKLLERNAGKRTRSPRRMSRLAHAPAHAHCLASAGTLTDLLLRAGGTDITEWFDPVTREVRARRCELAQARAPRVSPGHAGSRTARAAPAQDEEGRSHRTGRV